MQHPEEEAFPDDHLLKGEMQANLPNQGWGRPQHLQHPQHARQSWHEGQQHPAYLPEVSRQYPIPGRDRVVRQTAERERLSKELIGRPSNFQHLGHINRAVTSNQTKEEVQNLFHMVNLYQEQVGALPGKPAEKSCDGDLSSMDGLHGTTSGSSSLAGGDGLRRQIDSGETGSRAFEDGVDDAGKVTFGEPSGFSHFEEIQKHDHSRFGSMKIRKEMISAPKDFQHVQSYGRQDLERASNAHQPVDVAKTLERTRLKDGDQEGEKKAVKKSFSARLLGSSHSLPRDGKLRKDMIGSPKNFHHVMGSGRILAGLELNNAQQEEETDDRSMEALPDPTVNLRKDLVDHDKDYEHVMDTGHTNDTQELKNLRTSIMEEEEEDRRPGYSPSPPPPPPPPHLHPLPTRSSHSRPPPSHPPPPPPPPAPHSEHSSSPSYSPLHYSTSSPTHTRYSYSSSPPTLPRHLHSSSPPRLPHSPPPPLTYSSSPPTHPRFHESSPPRLHHSSPPLLPHSSSPTHHHRLHHSSPPSHPPPPVPTSTSPSSNRRRASRFRKDMIGTPTNFQHVMGTAPCSAAHEGVPVTSVQTGEDDNPLLGSQEERQKSALRVAAETAEASKPFKKKSTIGPPTNFQHVVHIDNTTPEFDVKQLLTENTSDVGGGSSVHDIRGATSHGGARQSADRKGIPLLLRPPAHAKIRKDMIGAPTNFQHISHAGFDVGKT